MRGQSRCCRPRSRRGRVPTCRHRAARCRRDARRRRDPRCCTVDRRRTPTTGRCPRRWLRRGAPAVRCGSHASSYLHPCLSTARRRTRPAPYRVHLGRWSTPWVSLPEAPRRCAGNCGRCRCSHKVRAGRRGRSGPWRSPGRCCVPAQHQRVRPLPARSGRRRCRRRRPRWMPRRRGPRCRTPPRASDRSACRPLRGSSRVRRCASAADACRWHRAGDCRRPG
jgi:hypothetical protein